MEYKGLIDIFNVSKAFRKNINEKLKAMGLSPVPEDKLIYPAVKNHLEGLKSELGEEIEGLDKDKASVKKIEGEDALKSIRDLDDLIKEVERDIKVITSYSNEFEQNKDINVEDISDLNEYLFDTTNLNEAIPIDEKRIFSTFLSLLFRVKKNAAGCFAKIRDYSNLKGTLRGWWEKLKKKSHTVELVKRSVFKTFEEIDAVLI